MDPINEIAKRSSEASLYEMLAEEAAELSSAASKYARFLRNEQPVKEGLTKEELFDHIIEEYADTESCATVCFCKTSGNPDAPKVWAPKVWKDGNNTFLKKMYRWVNRLKNKEE